MTNPQPISDEEFVLEIINDAAVRQQATREDFLYFWTVYCTQNITKLYDLAPFQAEIIKILQDSRNCFFVLEGFRGSSKSSIANQAFAVWSIVGKQQAKFILIIAGSAELARQYLTNIKALMMTEPLRSDMGPFKIPDEGEWRSNAIDIPKYGARIAAVSFEQHIRGMLHISTRPQIVILDDLENVNEAQSADRRQSLYNSFTSNILPVGDKDTQFVVIGTRLHDESLMMRLKKQIDEGKRPGGIFRSYPIIDSEGNIAWKGKFKSMADVDRLRQTIGDDAAWNREFMLQVVPIGDPPVKPEWIKRYSKMPTENYQGTYIGVDPAISKADGADETAMVAVDVFFHNNQYEVYVRREIIHGHLSFEEQKLAAITFAKSVGRNWPGTLVVEDVGYQRALIEMLQNEGMQVITFKTNGVPKETRLKIAGSLIQAGKVYFPEGPEGDLIVRHIVNFHGEDHDDIADALAMALLQVAHDPPRSLDVIDLTPDW